jgi:hypothetical protein
MGSKGEQERGAKEVKAGAIGADSASGLCGDDNIDVLERGEIPALYRHRWQVELVFKDQVAVGVGDRHEKAHTHTYRMAIQSFTRCALGSVVGTESSGSISLYH